MTKAFLINSVEADGDDHLRVVNEATFNWILRGGEMPACQKSIQIESINTWLEEQLNPPSGSWVAGPPERWKEMAETDIAALDEEITSPYAPQERAMMAMSSEFNGNVFDGYSTKDAMEFIRENGLTLENEFVGLSW